MSKFFESTIKPEWEEIENGVMKSVEFFKSSNLSIESINALTMIITSLLENAIKYGSFHRDSDMVSFSIEINTYKVTVETKNYVEESSEAHLKRLDERIQWIRGFQNPFESYIERLKEVASRPFNDKESGLGLVRMAYEGQAILDFYVDSSNVIAVSAVYQF